MSNLTLKALIKEIKLHIEVIKLSANDTRIRGLLLMMVHEKMTLTDFSSKIGRSKSTVLHHLKKYSGIEQSGQLARLII